jgi:hypothetical protein
MTVAIHPPRGGALDHPLARALAFNLIMVLLVVRLGTLTEEVLITPIEDAIFGVAFIVDAEKERPSKLLVNKAKYQLECLVPQGQITAGVLLPTVSVKPEHVPVFSPRDLVTDIFIPPEEAA